MKTKIIGITGPSASGKTVLAKKLKAQLTEAGYSAQIIHEDGYYKDGLSDSKEVINYDHPDAFDHQLLRQHIQLLLDNQSIEAPIYDYHNHCRRPETEQMAAADVIIVEGILTLHRAEIRYLFDLTVFVDTDLDVCFIRRISRDTRERGRDIQSVIDQYQNTVRPMYHQFVLPTRKLAQVVLQDGIEDNRIFNWLRSNDLEIA